MANKITTRSYLIKRLRDSGYVVDRLEIEYPDTDKRRWTIILDNGCSSVLTTCYKDGTLSFYDGNHFIKDRFKLSTDSVEVIVDYLNTNGIINKHSKYGSKSK